MTFQSLDEFVQKFDDRLGIYEPTGCIAFLNRAGQPYAHRPYLRRRLISRTVLELKIGRALRPDEHACHTCDHPWCINWEHLWVGSRSDNAKDMHAKKRGNPWGSNNPVRSELKARGLVGAHTRWHVKQGVVRADCEFCSGP